MRIEVFTFCWNEMKALPFAYDYWRRYATHVTVFDNGSTDGSLEFLASHPDFITVERFETGGQINDQLLLDMKNNCWKRARGRADLVVVGDMDEMLIPMGNELERMKAEGFTVCVPRWFVLMSDEVPSHQAGKLLHQIRPWAIQAPGKVLLFDPNKIDGINYDPGAHQCKPSGVVRWFEGGIYCLHTDHNFSLDSKIQRYHLMNARMSDINKKKGWGIHYGFSESRLRAWWEDAMTKKVNLNEILAKHG